MFDFNLVDLGLPSGTLWADRNVGAGGLTDSGDYFAFGEIEPRTFSGKCENCYARNKKLKHDCDAAYHASNGKLKIPNNDKITELIYYTEQEFSEIFGGVIFKSKINGEVLFFPLTGELICQKPISPETGTVSNSDCFKVLTNLTYLWSTSKIPNFSRRYGYLRHSSAFAIEIDKQYPFIGVHTTDIPRFCLIPIRGIYEVKKTIF